MNKTGGERKLSWHNLKYYPGICLEILRNTMKNSSRTARLQALGRDLEPGHPKYEPRGVLPTLHSSLLPLSLRTG
jgi:hypothetical protein